MERDMNRLIIAMGAGFLCVAGAASASAQMHSPQDGRGFRSIVRLCAVDQQWTTQRMGERLTQHLNLTEQQKPALKDLQDAIVKAKTDAKAALCGNPPDLSTLPKRLEFQQKRLQIRIDGLRAVQPRLETFYAALTGEQQAELNHLWQHRAMMAGQGGREGWRGDGQGAGGRGWGDGDQGRGRGGWGGGGGYGRHPMGPGPGPSGDDD
jgi:hypothetical protein